VRSFLQQWLLVFRMGLQSFANIMLRTDRLCGSLLSRRIKVIPTCRPCCNRWYYTGEVDGLLGR